MEVIKVNGSPQSIQLCFCGAWMSEYLVTCPYILCWALLFKLTAHENHLFQYTLQRARAHSDLRSALDDISERGVCVCVCVCVCVSKIIRSYSLGPVDINTPIHDSFASRSEISHWLKLLHLAGSMDESICHPQGNF